MRTVGYMEGTNSELLTNLIVDGIDTLPLSNGWDNHGKFIAHLTRTDNVSVVVGYLHKFFTLSLDPKIVDDIFSSLKAYKVPTVFIVPKEKHEKAKKLLKGRRINYTLADPANLTNVVKSVLKVKTGARKTARKTTKRKSIRKR
jgi:hypothetical protein